MAKEPDSVGSVSDGQFTDFNVIKKLVGNDTILNDKILKHSFYNTDSNTWLTEETNRIRIRCFRILMNNCPPKTTTKRVTFSASAFTPIVHLSHHSGYFRVNAQSVGKDGFTISAYNTHATAKKNVLIYCMLICVDSE